MPTMAFIEDDHMRLTVLSGQPSGVASLQSGTSIKSVPDQMHLILILVRSFSQVPSKSFWIDVCNAMIIVALDKV